MKKEQFLFVVRAVESESIWFLKLIAFAWDFGNEVSDLLRIRCCRWVAEF